MLNIAIYNDIYSLAKREGMEQKCIWIGEMPQKNGQFLQNLGFFRHAVSNFTPMEGVIEGGHGKL